MRVKFLLQIEEKKRNQEKYQDLVPDFKKAMEQAEKQKRLNSKR